MVFDFELHAEFNNHNILKVGSVVSDDPFRDVVLTYEVMFDEPGYNILGN